MRTVFDLTTHFKCILKRVLNVQLINIYSMRAKPQFSLSIAHLKREQLKFTITAGTHTHLMMVLASGHERTGLVRYQ